jgi:hypothetical protein
MMVFDAFVTCNLIKTLLPDTHPPITCPRLMVVCTLTKKAYIFRARREGQTFRDIGNTLSLDHTVVMRCYRRLEKQGPQPNFYAHAPIPGCPRLLTPHTECRAPLNGQ